MSRVLTLLLNMILRGVIRFYQLTISPLMLSSCRFEPSCSEYARQAIERHGAITGIKLATARLLRCHPWGAAGFDPVPESSHEHSPSRDHG